MRSGISSAIATAIPSTSMVRSRYPSAAHLGADTLRSGAMTRRSAATRSRDGVARVTINRPERRNAMSYGVMHGLRDAMATRTRRRRRSGSSCSPARATRRSARAPTSAGIAENEGAAAAHEGRGLLADLFRDMWSLGKPIVARVRGYALAGGFGLACACDLDRRGRRRGVRHARDQRRALALHDHGAAAALDAAEDRARPDDDRPARRRGRRRSASGSCSASCPVAELDATVDALAAELAAKSPLIMHWGRDSFYRVLEMDADAALVVPPGHVDGHDADRGRGRRRRRVRREARARSGRAGDEREPTRRHDWGRSSAT